MTATLYTGQRRWSMEEDDDGHRTYKLQLQVRTDSSRDGPATVRQCPGLPLPGSFWEVDDDVDVFATCKRRVVVTPRVDDKPGKLWLLDFVYSTKPDKRCNDTQVEDPILEPQKISGTFVRFTEQATRDRFNQAITNSAHEQIRGPHNEWDADRMTVRIEQNVADLELDLLESMANHVNEFPLWGFPPRTIKLFPASWERKFQGSCQVYYTRILEFEIRYRQKDDGTYETWDRDLLDEGDKVLQGYWGTTFRLTGTTTASNRLVTGLSSTAGISIGTLVTGAGIPAGAGPAANTVVSHIVDATSVLLSKDATASGTVTLTFANGSWIPANVGGLPPDPRNPAHFMHAIDRAGNPMHIILNGKGVPAETMVGTGNLFVSVSAASLGNPLHDTDSWVPLAGPFDVVELPDWEAVTPYRYGQLVLVSTDQVYLCLEENTGDSPLDPATTAWLLLGTAGSTLADRGNYDDSTTYDLGDIVKDSQSTSPGRIHVERYDEADFLLLNVPLIF